jgi:hypothetical protein
MLPGVLLTKDYPALPDTQLLMTFICYRNKKYNYGREKTENFIMRGRYESWDGVKELPGTE